MTKKPKPKRKNLLDEGMAEKGYVNVQTAAGLLRVAVSTAHRLCDDQKLEHVRVGGGTDGFMARVYVKRTSLREYLGPETAKILGV